MKAYSYLFLILCVVVLAACQEKPAIMAAGSVKKRHKLSKIIPVTRNIAPDTICIAAVGDMMLGSSYPDDNQLPPDSAKGSFATARKYLAGADIVFGNLEGTLLDSGMPATYKKKLQRAYLFRMPTYYGNIFKKAGFNLLSVANNHITDFGEKGYTSTTETLDSCGIHYAGLETCPTSIFEQRGIKYGFCAFAPNAHTVSLLQTEHVGRLIRKLKQQCDIVIVSFHGGAEGALYEHVPHQMESFMGGKRGNVDLFAHIAVDAGADIVLGNGPHVSRAMEIYKGRLIAYSLGNFCTYKCVSVAGVCGLAPLLKVWLDRKGEFIKGSIISFTQTHETGLRYDSLNHAAIRIRLLTEKDFPESGLVITDDGKVIPRN
ncbi:MAG: CapA family protein [Bacteroidetes bacterium]|nr:CapA family protein [Bacteroidota bacterium]